MDDLALLCEYAAKKSEAAFETLVSRYINVVYSAALRQVGDPHLAEEIAQAVFIILARKAGGMGKGTLLLGWLVRTARFTASAQIRTAGRRRQREQEAYMERPTVETSPDSTWELMSPLLDEALASLNAQDRQAVLLRYLEQKSLAEVGASLAVNEDTARKRVARALEKLRQFFTKRGVVLAAAAIGGAMSAHAVQAAPAGLAGAVAATAFAHTAAGGSTLALVKGALKIMAWTKAKMAVVAGVGVLLAAGTTTMVVKELKPLEVDERWFELSQTKNPGAAGLRNTVQDSISGSGITSRVEGLSSQNIPMYALAYTLENHLEIPVLDRTGLTNRFAIDLRWDELPGETTADTTKRVVLDQLGLELVPGRESIEMLVVERVKN